MATRSTGSKKRSTKTSAKKGKSTANGTVFDEVLLVLILAVSVMLLFSTFGLLGKFGKAIGQVMFGLFGMVAFLVPFFFAFALFFTVVNKSKRITKIKVGSAIALLIMLCCFAHLIFGRDVTLPAGEKLSFFYRVQDTTHLTGGLIGGAINHGLKKILGTFGTVVILLAITIISGVLLTEKSFFRSVKKGGENILEDARRMKEYRSRQAEVYEIEKQERKERAALRDNEREIARQKRLAEQDAKREAALIARKERAEAARAAREEAAQKARDEQRALYLKQQAEEQLLKAEQRKEEAKAEDVEDDVNDANDVNAADDAIAYAREPEVMTFSGNRTSRRSDNKVSGVMSSTKLFDMGATDGEMREITDAYAGAVVDFDNKVIPTGHKINIADDFESKEAYERDEYVDEDEVLTEDYMDVSDVHEKTLKEERVVRPIARVSQGYSESAKLAVSAEEDIKHSASAASKPTRRGKSKYKLPPTNLLNEVSGKGAKDSSDELKETADKLKETLKTFGVNVSITGMLRGPAVTRYEIQPEVGVKVSRVVSLTDDLKLALAATDIRMEAPIPGKSAIGIEVPNRENSAVQYRELVESRTFRDSKSKISFAVGKDLNGQSVVTDIAKMPHLLIAGATGSGKSVCINTLIMSILYKATPEDVRLIMIDPKVVELSVYNGIPHLLLPVVTDPKKANAALQWAVNEMMRRYQCFADLQVRDMVGYNKIVTTTPDYIDSDEYQKMPQIVIIVDELADLMMVAAKEVEESICRLAQLARAAGIHLILATQRPSVDVITGLIKANMPSRIAFSVSSGVDSRTILDMVGAEKLLGKGDMLFYPQGYTKPARVQGAFVSDDEVKRVVAFLKDQIEGSPYDEKAKSIVENATSQSSAQGFSAPEENGLDPLFYECGRSIIDKDKASIGMLQRLHKVGFNRAARIMDQLADAGVVGPEEGTKPRQVLMTLEQFEEYVQENNQ